MFKTITALSFLMLFAFHIEAQLNMQLRAQLTYPGDLLANIGGYVDSSGNEYALVGTSHGLSIVDVTDPTVPVVRFTVPGVTSNWREVKTWHHYAYVTNENGNGLQIVNLGYLPDSVQVKQWQGDSTIAGTLRTIHALHIDNGYGYLFGCGNGTTKIFHGAAIICDLNADPWNPHYLGHTTDFGSQAASYIHDGFVLNDTLWAGHIYEGVYRVWNCVDKANPVLLATQSTPTQFTHNTWLSDDHQTLFTTDETSNSFLTAYDVSDLSAIRERSRFQTAPGSNSTVHNTHILNDYAVTSWYTEGVVITDVSRPDNPVEVGKYDTYPGSGGSTNGCWGVYPYLPSGNLVVSDIQNGLFVFTPSYVRGCYLEGLVSDSVTGTMLQGVTVSILSTGINKVTNISGEYRTGASASGIYNVTFSKNGYYSKTISGVSLANGIVTNLNVELASFQKFNYRGIVVDSSTGLPLTSADVWCKNALYDFKTKTNTNGEFSFIDFYDGSYEMTIGMWGYQTRCFSETIPFNASADTFRLVKGYYDDFTFDNGWTVSGTSLNLWERGIPIGTFFMGIPSNPGVDVSSDCASVCFVTDNGGGSSRANDVDNGNTVLTSPVFDLLYLSNPSLEYSRWFFNIGGTGSPNDSMKIYLSNGSASVLVEAMCASSCGTGNGTWVQKSYPISSLLAPTSSMQLSLVISDDSIEHVLEGGFDKFQITGTIASGTAEYVDVMKELSVFPNPSKGNFTITCHLPLNTEKGKLLIMDITGRVLNTLTLNAREGKFETGDRLAAGIYLAAIQSQGYRSKAIRLIKAD